ncbi:Hypothetical protein I5071_11390 [Sandaracinus amylolyticus]|nr:Hypothetical protein I5071_11390 [Sandaracinus amylolyticus]
MQLVSIPTGLRDDEELATKSLFEACLGHTFVVQAIQPIEGSRYLVELYVGHVVGTKDFMHSIWVEPEHLVRAG